MCLFLSDYLEAPRARFNPAHRGEAELFAHPSVSSPSAARFESMRLSDKRSDTRTKRTTSESTGIEVLLSSLGINDSSCNRSIQVTHQRHLLHLVSHISSLSG